MIETYWSLSSPLTCLYPSWEYVEETLYLTEYIITIRMRDYMFRLIDKDGKKTYQLNSVMADNKEVVMPA